MANDAPSTPPYRQPLARSASPAPLYLPAQEARQHFGLPDKHRDRGIHLCAGSGSGKSLMMGSLITFFDFLRGVPQVLFDPHGQMIDAFLLQIAQFSEEVRHRLWKDIIYVDMSGGGDLTAPFPLLYDLGGETRQDIADRPLSTFRALDPQLESAPLLGWNALYRVGSPTGVILSCLGLQLDSALDLLRRPEQWVSRIEEAVRRYPEAQPAADFFLQEYLPMSASERLTVSSSYRSKIEPIVNDPAMRDMFCAARAAINWADVVARRQTVCLDFRGETNDIKRALKTRAVYDNLLAYIKHRGPGKHRPIAIHIDEITELTNQTSLGYDLFAADLDYLINVLARNYSVWLTAAHQEMWQVSEKTQKTLMSMGTQIYGVTSDLDSAQMLAYQYGGLDSRRVKRFENVWASESLPELAQVPPPPGLLDAQAHYQFVSRTNNFVIDQRAIDWSLPEQAYEAAKLFMGLKPFEFLVKPRGSTRMRRISTARYVGDPWPTDYPEVLAWARGHLSRRLHEAVTEGHPSPEMPITEAVASDTMGISQPYGTDTEEPLEQGYWDSWKDGDPTL